jgi:hypothetical protein
MTVETPAVVEPTEVVVEKTEQTAGTKRAFEEMQTRAVTIHDLEAGVSAF